MTAEQQMIENLRDKYLEPPESLYESEYEVPEADVCLYRAEYGYEEEEPLSMFTQTELDNILQNAHRKAEYITDVKDHIIFYIPAERSLL